MSAAQPGSQERTVLEAFFDLAVEFDAPTGRHLALASHHSMIAPGRTLCPKDEGPKRTLCRRSGSGGG